MYQNHETQWQIAKLERAMDLARAERLAGLGWRPETARGWLRRLTAMLTRQRPVRSFEREEALARPAARGL